MSTQRTRDEYRQLIGLLITHREAIEKAGDHDGSFAAVLECVRYLRDAIPLHVDAGKKRKTR